jgi:3-oxoadipate enol-lactonase
MPVTLINGFQMHYRLTGDGWPAVMAHGLMGSIAMMDELGQGPQALASRALRVINYDARGHGRSGFTKDTADYSWFSLARDMYALLRHLGVERAHIGGGSMGAGTSLVLALDHPELVERLVLIAPPPMGERMPPVSQMFGAFATLIESAGLERAVEVVMALPQWAPLRETNPQQYEWMRGWLLSQNAESIVYAMRGLLQGPSLPEERFAEIRAPALILAHPDDDIHPLASARWLHETIPGSRLVVAPSMLYFQEHPDEMMRIVADFLSDGTPSETSASP